MFGFLALVCRNHLHVIPKWMAASISSYTAGIDRMFPVDGTLRMMLGSRPSERIAAVLSRPTQYMLIVLAILAVFFPPQLSLRNQVHSQQSVTDRMTDSVRHRRQPLTHWLHQGSDSVLSHDGWLEKLPGRLWRKGVV